MTIDCPSDCPHLVASRRYDRQRRAIEWQKVPFQETKISTSFVAAHERLLLTLAYHICLWARDNRHAVDSDVRAALEAFAETYRTLAGGIYYEKPPEGLVPRGLYEALKAAVVDLRKAEAQQGLAQVRDAEIRDALIFLAQLGATQSNGRPKGRAYLDFLRTQFKAEEFLKPASNILLLP